MCLPGNNNSEGSYDADDAKADANFGFGMDLLKIGGGFLNNRSQTDRKNRLMRQKHEDDLFAYDFKYNNDVIAWQSEMLDAEGEVDMKFREAVDNIAQANLDLFNSAKNTSNEMAAAYTKMLSVGMGEQSGRRAGGTNMLAAIQQRGQEMAALGARLAGKAAETSLRNSQQRALTNQAMTDIKVKAAMGRPIPGTPPKLRDSDLHEYDSPLGTIADVGSAWMKRKATERELTPPPTNKDSSGGTGDVGTEDTFDLGKDYWSGSNDTTFYTKW